MSARPFYLLAAAFLVAFTLRAASAQDPPARERPMGQGDAKATEKGQEEPAKPPPATDDALAEQGKSPLFYMLTRDGQLVLASNIKYEDIQEYFDLKQKMRQQSAVPNYAVTGTDIQGVVAGKVADLTVRVDFDVTADATGPIPVPLNLGGLVRPQFQYRGDGKQFVVFDGQSFVCWIKAKAGTKHSMTIKAVSPVAVNDEAHRLNMSLPYAPSRIQLDVPVAKAEFALSDQRSNVANRKVQGRRTLATIDSRGGDLEVRWSPAQTGPKTSAPLIFASTSLTVRIENPLLMRVDAEIEVRAARGELDEFEIRLPRGLKLLPRRPTGYTLSDPVTGEDGNQVLQVKVDTPAQRAPRIRLSGEITLPPEAADSLLEVWGFEVVGANQTGDITLLTAEQWVVTPVEGDNVRRDRSLPESPRQSTSSIRFTVVNQPCSLKIAVRPKQVRVVVDPTYRLDIGPTKTQLELRLLCRFGNGRPLDLDLPLEGWDVRELLPERLAGGEGEFEIEGGRLTIPLGKVTEAPMGDYEVIIRAERVHQEGAALELPLPAPEVGKFSPGLALVVREPLVVAAAANNVELTPDLAKMPNVTAENIDQDALPEALRKRQQTPIAFRADAAPLAFHATQQVRRRSVVATPNLTLDFEGNRIRVTQDLRLDVLYEPLSQIRFAAPAEITSKPSFQVALGSEPLKPESVDANGFSISMPESQLGEFNLKLEYELPLAEVRAATNQTLSAAIVLPAGPEYNVEPPTVRCLSPDDLQVELASDAGWTETSTASRTNDKLEQQYESAGLMDSVVFEVRSAEVVSGSITVERMWVQTWLTASGRRERAVFRVATPNNELTLSLPEGGLEDVVVAANGFRIEPLQIDERQIQFELPEAGGKEHLIEVWYRFDGPRSPIGNMDLEMPSVVAARRINQFYWELITPKREHLFTHPATLTSEMRWRRRGVMYGRESLWSTEQLTASFGATPASTPADANRYLFSSLGGAVNIQAQTIRRSWLVILAASGVMLLGGAWIALRGNSRALFFLFAAVVIGSFATIYPNPAVVAAQAGFLGLGCLMIGRLVRWTFWRNRSLGVELHGGAAPTATATVASSDSRASVHPSTTRVHVPSESGA